MDRKLNKLNGLRILRLYTILFAIIMSLSNIYTYIEQHSLGLQDITLIIATVGLLISGIFIIKLLEWARKLLIASYSYYIVDTFIPLHKFIDAVANVDVPSLITIFMGLLLFVGNIYYFTRKEVRNSFAEKQT